MVRHYVVAEVEESGRKKDKKETDHLYLGKAVCALCHCFLLFFFM